MAPKAVLTASFGIINGTLGQRAAGTKENERPAQQTGDECT